MLVAAAKTRQWIDFNEIQGLEALAKIHPEVCKGSRSPKEGIIVNLSE